MKSIQLSKILIAACTLLVAGCFNQDAVFPVEPKIFFISLSPEELSVNDTACIRTNQCILLKFRFEDGDGDLGNENAEGPENVFLTDLRPGLPYKDGPIFYDGKINYKLPQSLTPESRNLSIQGTIEIALPYSPLINPFGIPDTIIYELYIVDRAGHKSNIIRTSAVILRP